VHEPIKFETELIPWMRKEADVFVCCHRQSDPSCTYLETLGCGVPIVAYRNRAIEGILDIADVGWLVRKDDLHSLADKIAELAADREQVATKARAGAKLAMEHSFENTFLNRVEQLRSVALQKTDWSSNSEEKAGLLSAVE
jgi:glycosyltransferase involved in cell wall biosynthesis